MTATWNNTDDNGTYIDTQAGCYLPNDDLGAALDLTASINSQFVPFVIISVASIILVSYIFKIRKQISSKNFSARENKRFLKDIKFSATILSLNLIWFLLNLPKKVLGFFIIDSNIYAICFWAFLLSYGFNFYVLLATNSMFRADCMECFRNFKKKYRP